MQKTMQVELTRQCVNPRETSLLLGTALSRKVTFDGIPINFYQVNFSRRQDPEHGNVLALSVTETRISTWRYLFFLPMLVLRGLPLNGSALCCPPAVKEALQAALSVD